MRKISREVILEAKNARWTGAPHLKETGTLLAHIKKAHTEDGHINSVKSTIAFRKIGETDQHERYKVFFPPILDGKNILAAIESNLCPFCEIEQAEALRDACLGNGGSATHSPDGSGYRYAVDDDGRLVRTPATAAGGSPRREWFDFSKGFWFPNPEE